MSCIGGERIVGVGEKPFAEDHGHPRGQAGAFRECELDFAGDPVVPGVRTAEPAHLEVERSSEVGKQFFLALPAFTLVGAPDDDVVCAKVVEGAEVRARERSKQ